MSIPNRVLASIALVAIVSTLSFLLYISFSVTEPLLQAVVLAWSLAFLFYTCIQLRPFLRSSHPGRRKFREWISISAQ